jgi:hypothetical protein
MSPRDLEPLPAEIASLFEAERRAPPISAAREVRLLARVEAAVGIGGAADAAGAGTGEAAGSGTGAAAAGGPATALGGAPMLGKVLLGLALAGVGIVGGVVHINRSGGERGPAGPHPPRAAAAAAAAPRIEAARMTPPPVAPTVLPSAMKSSLPPRSSSRRAPVPSPPAPSPADLAAESALLERARAALARADAAAALDGVSRHLQKFPNGLLAEEREAVWIQALVLAGDRESAARRARQFDRRFPSSVQSDAVAQALARRPADARAPNRTIDRSAPGQ